MFRRPPDLVPDVYAEDTIDPSTQEDLNYGMGQRPESGIHWQGAPAGVFPGMRIPGRGNYQPGQLSEDVPDGSQQKLAMHHFDGKEI